MSGDVRPRKWTAQMYQCVRDGVVLTCRMGWCYSWSWELSSGWRVEFASDFRDEERKVFKQPYTLEEAQQEAEERARVHRRVLKKMKKLKMLNPDFGNWDAVVAEAEKQLGIEPKKARTR